VTDATREFMEDARRFDVLSFGESLVDFLPARRGCSLREVDEFRKVVGGAPTNLALGLARLGCPVGLHGKVGNDEFGEYILQTIGEAGVDTTGVTRTDEAQTGLTFVTLEENGDRSFLFYREPSADMTFRPDDVSPSLVASSGLFQVGSNLLTREGVREATFRALEAAVEADCLISIDPNIRVHMWPSPAEARQAVLRLADDANIFKVNEEELELLTGDASPEEAWLQEFAPRGVELFVVTLGPDGAIAFGPEGRCTVEAPEVEVLDTTGAGDGFLSGFLGGLTARLSSETDTTDWHRAIGELSTADFEEALRLGCHIGSLVCTELGATPPLPTRDELPDHLQTTLER
jgi:fructokinase